jgi:hypothetical protein
MISMIGNTALKPDNASAPTPWPINILSTILYSELMITPANAGKKYFHINAGILALSIVLTFSCVFLIIIFRAQSY